MTHFDQHTELWNYLSETQRDLINEGDYLVNDIIKHHKHRFKDYAFIVFPYAKSFEGFLKQLFLDLHFISHLDYISDHFRLGKYLSPNLIDRLDKRSLYYQITQLAGEELAEEIWQTWKLGRNQIFHYYPHNIKAITFEEAESIIANIIETMIAAYRMMHMKGEKVKLV